MTPHPPPAAPEPLSDGHDCDSFDSGFAVLDHWLKRRARPKEAAGASRTFVTCSSNRVVGYYCLSSASIMHRIAPGKIRRNMPEPIPAVLIGRLALDRSWQGQGLGAALLRDAVLRIAGAAAIIGVRAILVHALSTEAKAFYERFGFYASPIETMTLTVTIAEVVQTITKLNE